MSTGKGMLTSQPSNDVKQVTLQYKSTASERASCSVELCLANLFCYAKQKK